MAEGPSLVFYIFFFQTASQSGSYLVAADPSEFSIPGLFPAVFVFFCRCRRSFQA
jgi:hypothetical protein